jgi:hypothetical protein
MEVSSELHAPAALPTPQGNSSRYPLDRRLGEPQSRAGRRVEEKNCQPPAGNRTPDHPIVQPVASRYPGSASTEV